MAEEITTSTTTDTTTDTAAEGGDNTAQQTQQTAEPSNALSTEALERLIQSRVDKATAEQGKKIAALQTENNKLKKEKLSDAQIKEFEINNREKALADKENALTERENRLFAIKAIKEAELDDGSDKSLELVDFVLADNEEAITERVKAFKGLVDKFVSAKVEQTFRANGRIPNGSGQKTAEKSVNTTVAEKLGQQRAEQFKKSNDVLNQYLGGK